MRIEGQGWPQQRLADALLPVDTALATALLLVEPGGDVPFATPACANTVAQALFRGRGQAHEVLTLPHAFYEAEA